MLPYQLEELRLNIAQDWSPDQSMPGGYSRDQINYLKDNWQANIKGKSKWDFEDCFWPKEGIYTTVEGRVLMCALNTAEEGFGNLFEEDIDDIRNKITYKAVKDGCARTAQPTLSKVLL